MAAALCIISLTTACGPSKAELAEQARQDSIRVADSIAAVEAKAAAEAAAAAEAEAKAQYEALHNEEQLCQLVKDIYALASSKSEKQAALKYGSEQFISKGRKYTYYASFCDLHGGSAIIIIKSYKAKSAKVKELTDDKCVITVSKESVWYDCEMDETSRHTSPEDIELILVDGEWKVDNVYKDGHDMYYWMWMNTQCG